MELKKFIVNCIMAGLTFLISFSTLAYTDKYNINVDAAATIQASFSEATSKTCTGSFKPCAGYMKYGMAQTEGNAYTKYTLSYKKTSSSTYTVLKSNMSFIKNNTYYGAYNICKVNGKNNYNFKITKINYPSIPSKVVIDLMVV